MRSNLLLIVMLGLIVAVSACATSSGDKWGKDSAENGGNKESSWKKSTTSTGNNTETPESSYWSRGSNY